MGKKTAAYCTASLKTVYMPWRIGDPHGYSTIHGENQPSRKKNERTGDSRSGISWSCEDRDKFSEQGKTVLSVERSWMQDR